MPTRFFTDLAHPNTSGVGGRYGESRARRRAEPFAYLRPNDHRARAGGAQRGERNRPAGGVFVHGLWLLPSAGTGGRRCLRKMAMRVQAATANLNPWAEAKVDTVTRSGARR